MKVVKDKAQVNHARLALHVQGIATIHLLQWEPGSVKYLSISCASECK